MRYPLELTPQIEYLIKTVCGANYLRIDYNIIFMMFLYECRNSAPRTVQSQLIQE